MKFTAVYKTYKNDLIWLKYSLISLDKYVSDISEIVIYYHNECEHELKIILENLNIRLKVRTVPVIYDIHGYIKQMVVKCMCFEDVSTDFIVYIDSDVIFTNNYSPTSSIKDDKIKWFIQKRNEYNTNMEFWKVWEESVNKMTKEKMNIFYMSNEFPFILKRKTIEDAYYKFIEIHGMDYNTFCKNLLELNNVSINDPITGKNGKFSIMASIFEEFEYLGWYSYNFTNDYLFTETREIYDFKKQFWSHGGLTEEIEKEIKNIL
jgi:hypothetical protein